MGQITQKKANNIFNNRHKVSRIRQWWFGSTTIGRNHFLAPCLRCHGNDKIVEVAEAPGFVKCHCNRCDLGYLG